MNITDVRVRRVAKEGKMKAVVSITIDEEFVVHDICLLYTSELVCVDSGSIYVTAGDKELLLAPNEMIFHKPNEFHALRGDGVSSPNLIVISFECKDPCMRFILSLIHILH